MFDKVHDKVAGNMKSMIQGKDAVLVQDGWSDIHNSPVIASSLHVNNKLYLLSATEAGSKQNLYTVQSLQLNQLRQQRKNMIVT